MRTILYLVLVAFLFHSSLGHSSLSHHRLIRVRSSISEADRLQFLASAESATVGLLGGISDAPGYALPLRIGSSDLLYLISLDTGSADLAVAGAGCLIGTKACVTPDAPYNASQSNSSSPANCPTQGWTCRQCVSLSNESQCALTTSYADGSGLQGLLYSDLISFISSENSTVSLLSGTSYLAAISNASAHFFGGGVGGLAVDGILGLAYQNLSASGAPPLFDSFVAQNLTADIFSLCLNDNGGIAVFGGVNESLAIEPLQYTPLTAPRGYYEMSPSEMSSMELGNFSIDLTDMTVVLDSGTTLLLLPKEIYANFTAALPKWCSAHEDSYLLCNPNTNLLNLKSGLCLNFHAIDLPNMPNITFTFPSADNVSESFQLSLTAREYVRYDTATDHSWDYCGELGIGINYNDNFTIVLGDVFLKGYYAVFDRENNRIGLAKQNATLCGGYAAVIVPRTRWLLVGLAAAGVALILLVLIVIWAVSKARNKAGYQPIN